MKPFNKTRSIEDADDYMGWAVDIFEEFLHSFTKENLLIRDVTEDDISFDVEISFIYTDKGQRLAERMKRRLVAIGEKHFPDDDIEVESNLFIEG